ncbi:MAG TPA: thioredoxin family protein [Longimicrobiaceae bacterium]|nr:thioredoxin family protein [Longimicrobiaceae bacterium]
MIRQRYLEARPFDAYAESTVKHHDLWLALRRRSRAPQEFAERVEALPGRWHLLVLSEDWCGDAVNTVPVLAALADTAANLELRILERDRNPDLMDAHLTGTSRSIPVAMVLDEDFREFGWWGPRPRELQEWVLGPGRELPVEDRYRRVRTWYARDQGRTTLEEVVSLLERAARERTEAVA